VSTVKYDGEFEFFFDKHFTSLSQSESHHVEDVATVCEFRYTQQ